MTDYFLDTEFIEDGTTIDLVSIALVCHDGRELYRCSTDAKLHLASRWVRENVLPHLPKYGAPEWVSRECIRVDIENFVAGHGKPTFWAYYADYDWVALCQLFGTMMQLPSGFPKFCMDLKQWSVQLGSPPHQAAPKDAHDALADARWNRELHANLTAYETRMRGVK